jgi:simple sugar transport system ATP-binding protein
MPETTAMSPFLEARGLHKRYGGVHALKGVDIQIERGKFYHLLGENGCGKSTLIKILSGAQSASEGEVIINGITQPALDPISALGAGIETVYQDLSLLPNLSVEENIGLTARLVETRGRLAAAARRGQMRSIASEATRAVGLPSDPRFLRTTIDQLPIATRQLVAIARAIAAKAGLVIMDEPTTALTRKEVAHLVGVIRKMQAAGTALLFVTHKLEEAREIGGTAIVMRDGAFVAELDMAEADLDHIGELMTNRRLGRARYRNAAPAPSDTPRLTVSGLTLSGEYQCLSFDLAPGEILGVTGLLDSGRNALGLSLAGLAPPEEGTVQLDGALVDLSNPRAGLAAGVAYVPEDRLEEGLFLEKSITDNIAMSVFDRLKFRLGIISMERSKALARQSIDDLKIVASDVDAPVSSLSGGNQQRVLIGRWLATKPSVLILHGPTVGVDVGSKDTIFRIIQAQAEAGMGVIIVSDDIPELLQNCDRIAVMRDGHITQVLKGATANATDLYTAIGGILDTEGNKA